MTLEEIPSIAGVRFRFYGDASDISAMHAVHDACREHDNIDPFSVCYRVPNLPPDAYERHVSRSFADGQTENVLLAEADDQIVAHARLEWWDSYDERRGTNPFVVYLSRAWVIPSWRGKGIGSALLAWAEARSRQLDRGKAIPGEYAANASEGEADARALLANAGYHLFFLSPELARSDLDALPDSITPAGFTIRPPAADDYISIARALIEANANAPGSSIVWTPQMLEARYAEEEAQWVAFAESCDPSLSRIALQGHEIAAFYLCRSRDACGDIANVGVRPAFRSLGLSRALMFHCLYAMHKCGLTTARVYTGAGVEKDAPPEGPLAMYLKLGFHRIAHHYRYRKPMPDDKTR